MYVHQDVLNMLLTTSHSFEENKFSCFRVTFPYIKEISIIFLSLLNNFCERWNEIPFWNI